MLVVECSQWFFVTVTKSRVREMSSLFILLGLLILSSTLSIGAEVNSSRYTEPYPEAASKKGLQVDMIDDALALGVKHDALNFNPTQFNDPAPHTNNPAGGTGGGRGGTEGVKASGEQNGKAQNGKSQSGKAQRGKSQSGRTQDGRTPDGQPLQEEAS